MGFDEILEELGSFGPYQRRVYIAVCLMAATTGFFSMTQVFIARSSDHWCKTDSWMEENCKTWNLSLMECDEMMKNTTIPFTLEDDGTLKYEQCFVFDTRGVEFSSQNFSRNGTIQTIPCPDGWIHDTNKIKSSINQDWDLVCDKKNWSDYAQSVFFLGCLIGSFLFGVLADRIGRHPTLFICLGLQVVFGVLVAFSCNYFIYVSLRFFLGTINKALVQIAFIIGVEFVGPKWRPITGITIQIFIAIGYILLDMIAYFIRDWRTLQLIISAPISLFFLLIPVIPESARWLLSQGKELKAKRIVKKASLINGRTLREPLFSEEEIKMYRCKRLQSKPTVLDLFRSPVLRWRTVNFAYNWTINNMVYYALTYSSGDLGVNVHLNFFMSGAVEILGHVLAILTINTRLGRRWSLATFLLIVGCACFINIGLPIGNWKTVAIAMIGKSSIAASYAIVYMYSAECFPTPVRSVGVGFCSMMSRLGAIASPIVLILGDIYYPAPLIIFGSTTILAGFLSLLFPETRGKKLPETIEEGKALGTDEHQFKKARTNSDKRSLQLQGLDKGEPHPRLEEGTTFLDKN